MRLLSARPKKTEELRRRPSCRTRRSKALPPHKRKRLPAWSWPASYRTSLSVTLRLVFELCVDHVAVFRRFSTATAPQEGPQPPDVARPTNFVSGRSHDRQRATFVAATGQLYGRLRAVSRGRRQVRRDGGLIPPLGQGTYRAQSAETRARIGHEWPRKVGVSRTPSDMAGPLLEASKAHISAGQGHLSKAHKRRVWDSNPR